MTHYEQEVCSDKEVMEKVEQYLLEKDEEVKQITEVEHSE